MDALKITDQIKDTCITIAKHNSDYVCSDCIQTLRKLLSILCDLDCDAYHNTRKICEEILEMEI